MAHALAQPFRINVGPLTGIGSLCQYAAPQLQSLNDAYRAGALPEVEWDLRQVEPRRMSMLSLTAFLSLAERLRRFLGHPARARVSWNPQVLGFWSDIDFLKIAEEYRLLDWTPADVVGGFARGKTNPHTKILAFPFENDVPDKRSDLQGWRSWKDNTRQSLMAYLELRCGELFGFGRDQHWQTSTTFDRKDSDQLANTTAELIVNALLWGQSTAFVGLQRSPSGITVTVSDGGRGFLRTVQEREREKPLCQRPIQSSLDALLYGSLINVSDWGLRRAIDTVTRRGGWVDLTSSEAAIRWRLESWEQARARFQQGPNGRFHLPKSETILGPKKQISQEQKDREGYYQIWPAGLRGSRISFEIPLSLSEMRH